MTLSTTRTKRKPSRAVKVLAGLLLTTGALVLGLACAGVGQQESDGTGTSAVTVTQDPSPAAAGSKAPVATVKGWGAGTYKVGVDIQAGSYKTTGSSNGCYWQRMRDESGELDAIIANDMITGPGRMMVKSTDKFVKFTGDCQWTRT